MLKTEKTALVVIDVQGKLAQIMHGRESLFENIKKIIKGARVLGIPIIWLEQYPEGLGPTVPEVAELLSPEQPIKKIEFSCCLNSRFLQKIKELNRGQFLLAGIETHVCIYQTSLGLIELGHEVHVAADAVSSRTLENKDIGLDKIKEAGGNITSVETALFELLRVAQGDKFKEIIKIVK